MIRPALPARAHPPQVRCKHNHRQQKEDACDLKPQNSAHAPEGPQKPAHATRHATGRFAHHLPGRLPRALRVRTGIGRRLTGLAGSRSLRARGHLLAGHFPGNSQSCTQNPANTLRFHLDYHGSSGGWGASFLEVR